MSKNKTEGLKSLYDYSKHQYNLIANGIDAAKRYAAMLVGPAMIMFGLCLKLYSPFDFKNFTEYLKIFTAFLFFLVILISFFAVRPVNYKSPARPDLIYDVFKKYQYKILDKILIKFIKSLSNCNEVGKKILENTWFLLKISFWIFFVAFLSFLVVGMLDAYGEVKLNKKNKNIIIKLTEKIGESNMLTIYGDSEEQDNGGEDEVDEEMDQIPEEQITSSEDPDPEDEDLDNISEDDFTKGI